MICCSLDITRYHPRSPRVAASQRLQRRCVDPASQHRNTNSVAMPLQRRSKQCRSVTGPTAAAMHQCVNSSAASASPAPGSVVMSSPERRSIATPPARPQELHSATSETRFRPSLPLHYFFKFKHYYDK